VGYVKGRASRGISFGGHMASAGARAYNGGLGAKPPTEVQGAEPPVGGQGASPPEAQGLLAFGRPTDATNLHLLQHFRYIAGLNRFKVYAVR